MGTEAKAWVKYATEEINNLYLNYKGVLEWPSTERVEAIITKWSKHRRSYSVSSLYDQLKELLDEYTQ